MANYTKTTDFAAKDTLPGGDTNKVIRGSEFETEFDAISTAIATKSDTAGPTFTGTVTIPTVDINAGAIDGTTIGANSAAAGTFTDLTATTADINGGTVDGATIGGSSAGAGTFTNLTATGTITFNGATLSDLGTVTTADINGGTIDGVTIGGSSAGAGTFTSVTATTADINGGTADNVVIGGSTAAAGTFTTVAGTTATFSAGVSGTTGTFSGAVSGTTGTFSGAVTGSNLNVSNWDTAYGWGDHSTEGYLTTVGFSDIAASAVTLSSETFSDSDSQIPTNAAVIDWVIQTYPTIVELNDLTANVTWATVPDAYISASSVNQHVSVEKATQSKTYALNEQSTLTLSSSISSGVPVVSVTKEVAQSGVTNNNWDVNASGENYTRLDSATATTLDFAGFDISEASASQVFSLSSQDTSVLSIEFNTDGTKMFICGGTGDDVNEYTLTTGFDVSTASFVDSFSVSSETTAPQGLAFNNDGTKMFVVETDADTVFQYNLSTGFDVSTASYSSNSLSVTSQESKPLDLAFNADGTKMFIVGGGGDEVNEYHLTTGFDLSTASHDSAFSVSSQDTNASGIAFNTDGTKMFLTGTGNNKAYEYSLSTGFDVSTASFTDSLDVSSEEGAPQDIAFNNNGTKMFIVGSSGNEVNEYTISAQTLSLGSGSFASADVGKTIEANGGVFRLKSTAGAFTEVTAPTSYNQVASGSWEMYAVVYNTTDGDLELSGATTEGFDLSGNAFIQSFSVASQETGPEAIAFNTDGTKMFVVGTSSDTVYQYTLTTGFDVSTASYASKSFSVNTQEAAPTGLTFNNDGTKMFICGFVGDDVNEYALSTAFDVSTASYTRVFSVSGQETNPRGIKFNDDGTKMFICGSTGDDVNEYALTTGFDISTASYTRNFSVSAQTTYPDDLAFNADGTKMFVLGNNTREVYQYTLTTGFDLSTASYSSTKFSVNTEESNPHGLTFNADGTKMFVVGETSDKVHEYSSGIFSSPSGYHAAHTTISTDSTYWTDINSMTADQAAGDGAVYYCVSTDDRTTWKIAKGTDGERSIVRNNSGTWQYNSNSTYGSTTWTNATTNAELPAIQEAMTGASSSTGFSITGASYDSKTFDPASQESNPRDIAFNSDGTKLYVIGVGSDTVYQYSLSTAYDISTASYDTSSFSVASQENEPQGLTFNTDGTKMFVVGTTGQDVNEYGLTTGFDLSTASYTRNFSVSSQTTVANGVVFNSDGTKMFIVESSNDSVFQYTLTTGFDLSTASYASKSISVSSQESVPTGIAFNADGTKMFITGTNGDEVNEYTLTTGFDVSTASFSSNLFDVSSQSTGPQSLTFNSDGTKMYISDNNGIFQYSSTSTSYPNQMDKTQLDAVPDANHFALANDLDLAIIFNMSSGSTVPSSDGVSINFDANSVNQGAVLGTDYEWDFPASNKVRIKSLAAQNLKVRVL